MNRTAPFTIIKSSDEKKQVFGWASVSVRVDGKLVVDRQNDSIDIADLETAVYDYTANFATAGEMHQKANIGDLIESVVFTSEKATAMGLSVDILPQGWWVGFQIHDDVVWEKIKDGTYTMFSIEGTATRVKENDMTQNPPSTLDKGRTATDRKKKPNKEDPVTEEWDDQDDALETEQEEPDSTVVDDAPSSENDNQENFVDSEEDDSKKKKKPKNRSVGNQSRTTA